MFQVWLKKLNIFVGFAIYPQFIGGAQSAH